MQKCLTKPRFRDETRIIEGVKVSFDFFTVFYNGLAVFGKHFHGFTVSGYPIRSPHVKLYGLSPDIQISLSYRGPTGAVPVERAPVTGSGQRAPVGQRGYVSSSVSYAYLS